MKLTAIFCLVLIAAGSLAVAQPGRPAKADSSTILDIMLSSDDEDPEPYIIQYIEDKEQVTPQILRVIGAPDTPDVYYVAYRIESTPGSNTCRNIWLVRISLAAKAAQGLLKVMSCDQAIQQGILKPGQKRLTAQYVPTSWDTK